MSDVRFTAEHETLLHKLAAEVAELKAKAESAVEKTEPETGSKTQDSGIIPVVEQH